MSTQHGESDFKPNAMERCKEVNVTESDGLNSPKAGPSRIVGYIFSINILV